MNEKELVAQKLQKLMEEWKADIALEKISIRVYKEPKPYSGVAPWMAKTPGSPSEVNLPFTGRY